MRTVYATVLEIKEADDVSAALNYVGRWIQDWYRRQRLPVQVPKILEDENFSVSPSIGHSLNIRHSRVAAEPNRKLIDILWEYPDQYDSTLGWVVRIALAGGLSNLIFSLELSVTGLSPQIVPANIKLGSPRVVREICRLPSVSLGGHAYSVTPEIVGAEEVEILVAELLDTSRPYPVAVISRRVLDDQPLVDASDLAERLAGVAKVYEMADKWAAFRLTEELTRPLSCFAGAVRIYWPRLALISKPFTHPAWMPWHLDGMANVEKSLDQIASITFEAAAFRHIEPSSITHLRNSAEREARELSRDDNKGAEELLNDLINLEEKLNASEIKTSQLIRENEILRANAIALSTKVGWETTPSGIDLYPADASDPTDTLPQSVSEAVEHARTSAKNLVFLQSAYQSAADSPFKNVGRVLEALEAIEEVASVWATTLKTGKSGGSLRQLFKKRGFEYADDISQTSKGKWKGEYTATYNGQTIDVSPHITIGAKQADTCISIHWGWDKEEVKAVVAHVGRHKTNTKT